jgi:DNA polymerase (family X)
VKRARRDRLDEHGISPSIHWRVREAAVGGEAVALEAARAGVPGLIRRLLELPAITTDQAVVLVRKAGVVTLADLELAVDSGRIRDALGDTIASRLKAAAAALRMEAPPIPLGRALDYIDALTAIIMASGAPIGTIAPGGDARRFEPLVCELVLVAQSADPAAALDAISVLPVFDDIPHRTTRRAILKYQNHEVDLHIAPPSEWGSVMFHATGSRDHANAVRARQRSREPAANEEDVYRTAGLQFIPAELRNGTGEIDAAAAGALPSLVTRGDIRGDLHMHSTYSDGRDPLDHMAAACSALGYEYIAITDHSARSAASRSVTVDQLARQRDEIAALRELYPAMAILHGIEVDIMPDGSLDFEDAVLEPLDIVLASLHDSARQDGRMLTRRCLQAIRHPLVNVITHPANRLVGRRAGYALDFDAVYAAAAETGTALEIDGAASHLDLDGEHARAAIAAGVTVTIDSDCHRARLLARQMDMGIGTARRGWVEPRHVLNARTVEQVRAFIAAKRSRGC